MDTVERKNSKLSSEFLLNLSFVLLLLALCCIRVKVFLDFDLVHIDSDQPYMWLGANDFSKGHFYEPRYYAQDYNTFFEALVAVPFIWLKLPVYYALPVATHIIFLFPYLFAAFYLFFHKKKIAALLVLAIVMCLPLEFDVLTSLPRGFVSGLFFTSFFVVSFQKPEHLDWLALNTVFALAGYFVNPNSTLVSVPFLFYLFLYHHKNRKYYLVSALCALTVIPLYFFFNYFYKIHPDYVMNDIHYNFSPNYFFENISDLDRRFAHISFFKARYCLSLLFVLFLLATGLYFKNKKAFFAFCIFILVACASFISGKTTEGSTWLFMSYGRMYLGIPLFIYLFSSLFEWKPRKIYAVLALIPMAFVCFKYTRFDKILSWHLDSRHYHGVKIFELKNTLEVMDFYKNICRQRGDDFMLISNRFWMNNIICYGGPAVDPDYPETEETKLEKRYWVRNKNSKRIIPSFIMVSSRADLPELLPKQHAFKLQKIDDYGLYHVTQNTLKLEDFIRFINYYEPYD